jgi:hypothetical protein
MNESLHGTENDINCYTTALLKIQRLFRNKNFVNMLIKDAEVLAEGFEGIAACTQDFEGKIYFAHGGFRVIGNKQFRDFSFISHFPDYLFEKLKDDFSEFDIMSLQRIVFEEFCMAMIHEGKDTNYKMFPDLMEYWKEQCIQALMLLSKDQMEELINAHLDGFIKQYII